MILFDPYLFGKTIDTGGGPYIPTYLPTKLGSFVVKYLLNNQKIY
jgi:hypothetical protein